MSFLLSLLAFAASLCALGLVYFRDPLAADMKKYDFSTPRASLDSRLKIEANNDFRAEQELKKTRLATKRKQEQLRTLVVKKDVEHRGYWLLFISYQQGGNPRHEVIAFDRNPDGTWEPHELRPEDVEKDNWDLANQMRSWIRDGDKGKDKGVEKKIDFDKEKVAPAPFGKDRFEKKKKE